MLGNNSCGVHSLLGAKHGRGLRVADNTHELEILTYDGAALARGRNVARRTGADHPRRRPPRRDLRQAEGAPRPVRRRDPHALPEARPPRLGLQPRRAAAGERLPRRPRAGRHREHLRHDPGSDAEPRPEPEGALARSCSATRTSTRPASTSWRSWSSSRPPWRGSTTCCSSTSKQKGDKTANLELLPRRQGLPDGRVRRRHQGGLRRPGPAVHGDAQEASAPAGDEAVRRPAGGGDALEGARRRARLDRLGARPCRTRGQGGRTRPCRRRRSAGYLRDLRKLFDKYDYKPSLYGHFGQGCIHCRVPFDLYTADGHQEVPRRSWTRRADLVVGYGGSLSGEHGDGQARGEFLPKMFGETTVPGVPRVQGDLGPGREDEPGQEDRRLPDRPKPPPRRRLQPAAAADALRLPEGQALVRAGGAAVRRRRRVPPRGRADHVPELHGHPRGEAQHPRPGPPALRDDERRGADRRLAGGGGQGRARPVPGVQGVQARLPGERGHGHLQGRVPVALLRGPAAAAARLQHGLHRPVGAAGRRRAGRRQLLQPDAGAERRSPSGSAGSRPKRKMPPFATRDVQGLVLPPAAAQHATAGRSSCGPTRSPTTSSPEHGKAAVAVLEDAGCQVFVPRRHLCCGRPLYDFGMLDTAKSYLRKILAHAAAGDRGRRAGDRAGAELHRRLPRRAGASCSTATRTPSGCATRRSTSASS